MKTLAVILAGAALLFSPTFSGSGSAAELKKGDPAPAFELPGSNGKTYKLSDLKGKYVVIAWFPKAFTGG